LPFREGEIVFYTNEDHMRRMMGALLGISGAERPEVSPRLRIADGDCSETCTAALAACGRDRTALLLYAREPKALSPSEYPVEYLARPFSFAEFLSRTERLLSGIPAAPAPSPADGVGLVWDREERIVRAEDVCVRLSPREAQVFSALYDAFPEALSPEALADLFGDARGNGAAVYITHLRKKLSALPRITAISYLSGRGYALLIGTPYGERDRIHTEHSEENKE